MLVKCFARFLAPFVAVALLAGIVVPAQAADAVSRRTYYLALGDSLAEGLQSVGPNLHGYANQLYRDANADDRSLRLKNLGCGGESTASMIEFSRCHYRAGSQLDEAVAFLDANRGSVAFVTITLGANDFSIDCGGDLGCGFGQVQANLPYILSTLRAHAGPGVPIVATNYYNPDLAFWFDDPDAAVATSSGSVVFNNFLEAIYADAGSPVADVETAFASTDFSTLVRLPGKGLVPLSVYNICTLTWMCATPPFGPDVHPNTKGYRRHRPDTRRDPGHLTRAVTRSGRRRRGRVSSSRAPLRPDG